MAKYVINIDDDLPSDPQFLQVIRVEPNGQVRITYIEFDTLEPLTDEYIDEHSRDLQDDAYERGYNVGFKEGTDVKQRRRRDADEKLIEQGRNEAWECAKRIAMTKTVDDCHNFSIAELEKIFGYSTIQNVFDAYSASEAIEKVKAYEEKQKANERIMFGDGLITKIGDIRGIALSNEGNGSVYVWREDCVTYEANVKEWKKTGETYPEVAALLEKMKGE